MGGSSRISSYRDAERAFRSTRSSSNAFGYSTEATQSGAGRTHPNLNIREKVRECRDSELMPNITPIAIGMDVTRSRGDDAKRVYEQIEQMLGSVFLAGAAPDPQLLFAAIGDAKVDRAPLQVGQFESDDRMDNDLSHMWLEEGGGGTGEESYELFAYYLARRTEVDAIDTRGQKGFCFFTGDEAPYPAVDQQEVDRVIGQSIGANIPTEEVFAELQERYHTFLIYPQSSMEERQSDIDAEIRQRLLKAGGRFENCSIRASLIWHTRDDLDLHVITPDGEHIYYGEKRSRCGGELDVDRNVRGETLEPIENIRWAKGTANPGQYRVYVQNYGHHDRQYHSDGYRAIPFAVELDIDGEIQRFEGETKAGVYGPASDVDAFTFEYTAARAASANADDHEAYTDEVILGKWRQYIPDAHIIGINDAKHATEAMVGVLALQRGVMDLPAYVNNMQERGVNAACIDDVSQALQQYAAQGVFVDVPEGVFA